MLPMREHREKLGWKWDRVNTHVKWHLDWMPRPAAGINCCSPCGGLNHIRSDRRFNWASRLTTSRKLSLLASTRDE